jgi:endogenous inhibitor of DNA gyrase (YacG/DUF329 family)
MDSGFAAVAAIRNDELRGCALDQAGAVARASHISLMSDAERPKCPICGKPAVQAFRPFCSKRCADVDLHRWFSGVYAVPVTEDEEEDERRDEGGAEPS